MDQEAVNSIRNGEAPGAECRLERFELPTEAVLQAVAAIKDKRIDQLETLYDAVDPDALNTLVDSSERSVVAVEFEYEGCVVEVTADRVRATAVR